ncbi:hypothetical protein NQ317_008208 [Molorchus minor]|uniref:Glucose-methanol-choline oxidoreductase N-terminal domain-containing protein n=1 Tax=Molorchus minor TaxID=1323400 RepID=A0ABQ9JU82_9CUCU|nr:hypothetical protein NQ317_008208 [Molorchus minor]
MMLLLVAVCIYLCVVWCSKEDLVGYYENLIETEAANAFVYKLPEDARDYETEDDTATDIGHYDFIIIGAGSTGSVIANRLSEIQTWRILLLEAGQYSNIINEIPSLYTLGVYSKYNWGFKSVPQKTACLGIINESCIIPRGKGVGGTTLINGLTYSRGHPEDYNKWAEFTNDPSWSYNNVLQYFKKSEDFHQTDPGAPVDWKYHGTGANKEQGYALTDYNARLHAGASIVQYNTKNGKRHDQATAFLKPVMDRTNLVISSESYVTKIHINNVTKEAEGCTFTRHGRTYFVAANKEVILSAGAISSPQILMLSGIGLKGHLEEVGIPVIQNLSVGVSLREHAGTFGLQFASNMSITKQSLNEKVREYLENGTGALTSNTQSHVLGWYQSSLEKVPDYPDLEMVTDLVVSVSQMGKKFLGWKDDIWDTLWSDKKNISFYFTIVLLHAKSVGNIKLKSKCPFEYPLIDYNLLSDPDNRDIDSLYEGIQMVLKLANTTAFKKIGAEFVHTQILPACKEFQYLSKDYWYCFLRQTTLAVFHPVGTCPVGKDPMEGAVVDSNFKVFGVRKLRVADSSIFPFTLSGHPHAPCTMIGEKISDVIKADYLPNVVFGEEEKVFVLKKTRF